jgi:dTDP-4-dehydrorhamnose 3,5-epimerase-like enzyme
MDETLKYAVKDRQTVTYDGERLETRIEGLIIKKLIPQEDHRGTLFETYRSSWNIHPDPLLYVYRVYAQPGSVRGWIYHKDPDKYRLPMKNDLIPFNFK